MPGSAAATNLASTAVRRRPTTWLEDPMLSKALSRLGGSAARHPWRVIAAWLLTAALAVVAAIAFGGRTADSMTAPGLDSGRAAELIERAATRQEGKIAQGGVNPVGGGGAFFRTRNAPTAAARA